MHSIAVYGRLVVRAVLSELTSDLPRAIPWHGGVATGQPVRRSFHLVTAASGLSKTHSTLASSQNFLKPRTFGDDACFVARHKLGDVIGVYCQCLIMATREYDGNSVDKLCHTRSVAYSAEQVLLNKRQIWDGTPKLDCYPSSAE